MTATPATSDKPRRPNNWISSSCGNVYYRPRGKDKKAPAPGLFPRPLIEPRRSRPHAIHIVTYPPGYVPPELRPPPESAWSRRNKVRAARKARHGDASNSSEQPSRRRRSERSPTRTPVLDKLLSQISSSSSKLQTHAQKRLSVLSTPDSPIADPATAPNSQTGVQPPAHAGDVIRPAPESINTQIDTQPPTPSPHSSASTLPNYSPISPASTSPATTSHTARPQRAATDTALVAPRISTQAGHPANAHRRHSMMSARSAAKSSVTSFVTELPKPVASGSGVSCSILLAEPNLFLAGFDHDGSAHRNGHSGTALLRGKLQLNVSKNVKLKAVQLKLVGRARTEWPEGIPPLKQDLFEEQGLRTQVLTFFNAMYDGWESEYGNQCSYTLKGEAASNNSTYLVVSTPGQNGARGANQTPKELKRLSLQNAQSRSFGKGESPVSTTTQAKGFKIFHPGTYDYSFELPIDHNQLETINLQYGSVRWELHATIDRAGAFKPNLHGMKEVSIIRVPDQMSLEMTEPISISRQWEDQLHYDIIISGKSFPIGGRIPIAFKLTPLAKVQVHKLKVYLTESIEYWTNDRRVTRKDPGRKVLLLEKSAGKPLAENWASSDIRATRGGELSPEQRAAAREQATRRRIQEASRRGVAPEPLPQPAENLLGDLDLGLENLWGSTEIEANVQIPTCQMMARNRELRLNADCSWKNVNVYHWIKVVMRISRLDPEDPTGTKRRHFEISIDSPFTVLNCRATQANTNLPAYTGNEHQPMTCQTSCGCPDAQSVPTELPQEAPTTLVGAGRSAEDLPMPPQAARLANGAANPASQQQGSPTMPQGACTRGARPMHLIRAPSFCPPDIDDDDSPPPLTPLMINTDIPAFVPSLISPPPQYDVVVGTPSVDGMADYFTRLAHYGFEDQDSSGSDDDTAPPRILDRSGRVNVAHPRSPIGRMPSRSMELSRPNLGLNIANIAT
ncbi:unnamed protein product [Clonostachys rosea f. rosea IK726]|uniref:Uncharacterized protein n=1 Tax=Clonostachys rosea f. rosea IK726 TaxID=1349383 RepID=A0ACA9TL75_BIOOC|nr:unnamed protein product [Clonostachys rosea f. rosea IK726]